MMIGQVRCMWCGRVTHIIWVHGYGQCALCGTNIDECCHGEHEMEDDSTGG